MVPVPMRIDEGMDVLSAWELSHGLQEVLRALLDATIDEQNPVRTGHRHDVAARAGDLHYIVAQRHGKDGFRLGAGQGPERKRSPGGPRHGSFQKASTVRFN